ncbi:MULTISPECIES: DUF4160 domain-containing protein [unclassified Thioalkalivibrio]|uniref:DUF4160 domain-containing protein n=1 Tax=unclassified Thioalkalivibrio TaxID=2621013 RepID=UPI00037D882B|nr:MULTISPECIES: DUF4160 domain-containing protein [unclassified Thioalkalivibrio]
MPTVFRDGPYRYYWFSHEPDEPPHVHVDRGKCSAKFWLRRVALARNMGFPAHELRRIREVVERRQPELLEAWNGFFGHERG